MCDGYLIIDVDARNGGVSLLKKLCTDIPEAGQAVLLSILVAETVASTTILNYRLLIQNHNYKGIDFKTSGLLGQGRSMLAVQLKRSGHPDDIQPAP